MHEAVVQERIVLPGRATAFSAALELGRPGRSRTRVVVVGPQGVLESPADHDADAVQSLLPQGYMTTSFRFDGNYQAMVIHQAKTVGNVDEPKACRTKLAAEVKGVIEHYPRSLPFI